MSSKWLYHSPRWYKQQLVVQRYYMNKDKHIPQGYKNSPLGIIPKEWDVKRLGDYVTIKSGESPSLYNLKAKGKYPYIKVEDMNNCSKYQIQSREYSDDEKNIIPKGSIIFPKRGAAILNNKVRIASTNILMDSNMMAITANRDFLDSEFLYYTIINEQLYKIADTSTIPQINNKHIIPYRFRLPSLEEQKQIVSLLITWDTAIEKQSELIEKLTLRKRALMQKLLTGKKRLPRFSEKWKRMTINEFAKEVSIKNVKSEDCIVLSCTKYDGLVSSLEYFGKQIYSNDLRNYKIVPRNHFVYATNHIEEGSIGYQTDYEKGLISPMYTVFYTDENIVDDSFLFAILKSHHLIYLYQSMMEGSINRRGGLRWDSFSTIKIDLPPLNEQKAISAFLKDLDKEIELANEKLAKLKSQKRGLMQQLLTGKKRIK